jgi:hypothetical protein
MCTMLTHDDNKMISIHSQQMFFICDLCIVKANDLYKCAKFKLKTFLFLNDMNKNRVCLFN